MGENITNSTIIGTIIIILSLVIIFIFISHLDLGGNTKKEICHNSVVLASTTSGIGHLDCEVYKLCIHAKGEKCNGEKFDKKIEIDINKKDKELTNQVWKIVADEMADCWSVYGEGKNNYIFNYEGLEKTVTQSITNWLLETSEYSCGVCSSIKFSKNVAEGLNTEFPVTGKIGIRNYYTDTNKGLYKYLSDNDYTKNQKYSMFLYGTTGTDNIKNLMWNPELGGFTLVGKNKKGEEIDEINPIYSTDTFLVLTGMSAATPLPVQFIEEKRLKESLVTRNPSILNALKQILPWNKDTNSLPACRGGFISKG